MASIDRPLVRAQWRGLRPLLLRRSRGILGRLSAEGGSHYRHHAKNLNETLHFEYSSWGPTLVGRRRSRHRFKSRTNTDGHGNHYFLSSMYLSCNSTGLTTLRWRKLIISTKTDK